LRELVRRQVTTLRKLGPVRHVKPHGALYTLAARERDVAQVIAETVRTIDPALILYGLAGSELVRAGRACGLRVAEEVFADRTYQRDGSLTGRAEANALITDEAVAVAQALRMIREHVVRAVDGTIVAISADTLCLHGDGPTAVETARRLRHDLAAAGIAFKAL